MIAFEKRIVDIIAKKIPEELCWETPQKFIPKLTQILSGTIESATNEDFIIVSTSTPEPSQTNKIWARFATNRRWVGFYAYIKGEWRKLYPYDTDDIIWKTGDSRNIPDGFKLIDSNTSVIKESVRNAIISQYVETSVGSGIYNYFAVIYVGY